MKIYHFSGASIQSVIVSAKGNNLEEALQALDRDEFTLEWEGETTEFAWDGDLESIEVFENGEQNLFVDTPEYQALGIDEIEELSPSCECDEWTDPVFAVTPEG